MVFLSAPAAAEERGPPDPRASPPPLRACEFFSPVRILWNTCGMNEDTLFPGMGPASGVVAGDRRGTVLDCDRAAGDPRLRRPDRRQVLLQPVCLEDRLAADHPARTVWSVVERMDLTRFYQVIEARGTEPGRPATDPRLLVALWLLAHLDGVGSARELDRRCVEHDAYRWLCGAGVQRDALRGGADSEFAAGHATEDRPLSGAAPRSPRAARTIKNQPPNPNRHRITPARP